MPPKAHALLSASSADRWIHCPPSARLSEDCEDKGSDFAAEGTDAHALCEYKLLKALGRDAKDPTENLTWFSKEMADCADGYAAYVLELVEEAKQTCPDPVVLVEQRVDFSRWVTDGFGTADCIITADGTLRICDYKHGLGVEVSAEKNPQMMCYALGALEIFDCLYDIDRVSMTIYQPRRSNVSTYEMTKDELYRWADETLKPAAEQAWAGKGEPESGSWCRFCKIRTTCRKRAEANLSLAKQDFALPPTLSDTEIAVLLEKLDPLINWANEVQEYALQSALNGTKYEGWKLVEGRANRRFTDENAVSKLVTDAGKDPYEHKLLGITAMEKLLGKKQFADLLGSYVEHPQGKPTLVPVTDKRPEMNNAKLDFANE